MAVNDGGAVFALLDDGDSTPARRTSRLYTGFVRERVCSRAQDLDAVCRAVEGDLRAGLHAVVLGDYDFGRDLQFAKHASGASDDTLGTQHGHAALRFLLFERCERLSRDEADAWLAAREGAATPAPAGIAGVVPGVDRDQFERGIEAVHAALRAGDSYQINYTYRLQFEAFGPPVALYRRLRERQRVPFGALIALPGDRWVLSCSPELFVEKQGDALRARPMKGTAARSPDPVADRAAAQFLANDPKNRAENVMIVDLLRNDLSRVAQTGSVRVPALFSVESYALVWQMTSTVEAKLRERTSFAGVMRALFPCGSITGAPKHRTMELIDAIEHGPRGLYTGTIGWLDGATGDDTCGDFCLSVVIRTLTLDAPAAPAGVRRGEMGVGAGIVLDSVAADEYEETRLKARFLTGADPGLELFETMYATRADGVRHLERHLARLAAGAAWLGFTCNADDLRARLAEICAAFPEGVAHRLRAALGKDGAVQLTSAPLAPLPGGPVGVMLAPDRGFAPVASADALLLRKTTRRAEFDRAWREAEAQGGFDMLFFNERGELTEGGRSNVFVKLDGTWWTPPLSAGVLPGVMRGVLLDDETFGVKERALTRADVLRAEALLLTNALRGAVPARLI
ncbi:aminodeoxychorismate synthase component I [Paraburkholderia acidipaludis]|uniref:aminodeoxychorismate synthase component I n=1 Tax=Paraburkholderia acidipaludis TaxID=660537 RepID=UPI000482DA45|nr:aminodeoxychorismate synthase component I [Paraburkholderia acidipaludis]